MSTPNEVEVTGVPRDTIALRVMIARHERHLSQRAAAELCGLTFGEWQGIEAGRKAGGLDRKIDAIAEGLRWDRDWLMWGGPLESDRGRPNPAYAADRCAA